jgi:hypothetical protein
MTINWVQLGAEAAVATPIGATVIWVFRALFKTAWKTLAVFEGMQTSLHTIATNDLPHLYMSLGEIRTDLKDMRNDFLRYVIEESMRGQDTIGFRRGNREHPTGSGHYPPDDGGSVREPGGKA